jgi:hypothetical protein
MAPWNVAACHRFSSTDTKKSTNCIDKSMQMSV